MQVEEGHVVNLLVANRHSVKRNSTPGEKAVTIAFGASQARVSD